MKAVILSDIHLGRYKYGKMNTELGIDTRTQDIVHNLNEAIKFAINKKVDMIIITGDLYHIKRPDQIFRRIMSHCIEKMLESKLKVFIILGNHDQGRTKGHDLVELVELSSQIPNLHVIEHPRTQLVGKDGDYKLLTFFPHPNKIENNIKREDFHNYQIKEINELQDISKNILNAKYKLFFGHFGTDCSKLGNSVDLGQVSKGNVVPLSIFDKDVWTRVYLGDIHKQQELNGFCRHVGSLCKVDFGEEGEKKGFYFYEDGKDEFIEVKDRNFMTIEADLTGDIQEKFNTLEQIAKVEPNIKESITRLKLTIKAIDRKIIPIEDLEKLLREKSWNYIGKTITEIHDDDKSELSVKEMAELDHMDIFHKYLEGQKEDNKKEVFDIMVEEGKKILDDVLNIEVK